MIKTRKTSCDKRNQKKIPISQIIVRVAGRFFRCIKANTNSLNDIWKLFFRKFVLRTSLKDEEPHLIQRI